MSESVVVRRINVDLAEASVRRLERIKVMTEATTYAEVIRAALRSYEAEVVERSKKVEQ